MSSCHSAFAVAKATNCMHFTGILHVYSVFPHLQRPFSVCRMDRRVQDKVAVFADHKTLQESTGASCSLHANGAQKSNAINAMRLMGKLLTR